MVHQSGYLGSQENNNEARQTTPRPRGLSESNSETAGAQQLSAMTPETHPETQALVEQPCHRLPVQVARATVLSIVALRINLFETSLGSPSRPLIAKPPLCKDPKP